MNKKIVLIVVLALGIIGIVVGVWWVNNNDRPVLPVNESAVIPGFTFPAAADEINWEDREIYKSGLTVDAQSALNELPQASMYYISLEIAEDLIGDIQGHETVRYFNTEPEPLEEIYFRLFPNFEGGTVRVSNMLVDGGEAKTSLESGFTTVWVTLPGALDPGESAVISYTSLEIADGIDGEPQSLEEMEYLNTGDEPVEEISFLLFPNFEDGVVTVTDLLVDGLEAKTSQAIKYTALKVDLQKALQPGDSVVIETDFILGIPTEMGGNYGLYGYFEDVLVLDTFYPMIPVYDKNGWYSQFPQRNGDHTYLDASFYLVQVQAPADLVMASSGVAVSRVEEGDIQTTVFAAGPARDFYLGGSREFTELKQQAGDLTVKVFARKEHNLHQGYALNISMDAIEVFSERVGDYPYTEFEVISSPMRALGIEYPGLTSVVVREFVAGGEVGGLPSEIYLESTVAHEVGHMWFYNTVGNDQQNQPWLDEALAQYLTYIYYLDSYGPEAGQSYNSSWYGRWQSLEFAEIPIGMPAGEYYSEEYRGREYGAIVYGRGPIFFLELETKMGLDTLMKGIQDYYQDHLWGIGTPEDLLAALEGACACELDDIFNEWVYGE